MRKLASVKRVSALEPIPGKDRIVLATIDGWKVIVKKDEFFVGAQCVYCEIDSIMPDKPEFGFLKDRRIRTMKLGGVISQGICFPMSILPQGSYKDDQDVTDIIGVTKYEPADAEPPATAKSRKKSFLMKYRWYRSLYFRLNPKQSVDFPDFVSKTDEVRIQNIPHICQDSLKLWCATEKVDGTSATYAVRRMKKGFFGDKFEVFVCSRNRRLPVDDGSVYWQVFKALPISKALSHFVKDHDFAVIQGEIIAPKIQGNKYKVSRPHFYAFNLITEQGRLPTYEMQRALWEFNIDSVPIVASSMALPDTVEGVLKFAHGESVIGSTIREGVVFRSLDGKDSFKAVDPEFLLQYKE